MSIGGDAPVFCLTPPPALLLSLLLFYSSFLTILPPIPCHRLLEGRGPSVDELLVFVARRRRGGTGAGAGADEVQNDTWRSFKLCSNLARLVSLATKYIKLQIYLYIHFTYDRIQEKYKIWKFHTLYAAAANSPLRGR